jgi:transposase-like protein
MFNERKFRAQLVLAGITVKELAEKLGINEATLYRKIGSDGRFTRQEINNLIEILDIKNPEEIFFAKELT